MAVFVVTAVVAGVTAAVVAIVVSWLLNPQQHANCTSQTDLLTQSYMLSH